MAKLPTDHSRDGLEDDVLEGMFRAFHAQGHQPLSEELEARILMQAAQVQRGFARQPAPVGRLRRIWADLGGWATATGLACATMAGLWLGATSPEALEGVWRGVGLTSVSQGGDFLDFDAFFEEI